MTWTIVFSGIIVAVACSIASFLITLKVYKR